MLTIQGKFVYEGDLKKVLPVKNINLKFSYLLYEYNELKAGEEGGGVRRTPVSEKTVETIRELKSTDYQLLLPEDFILGDGEDAVKLFERYITQSNVSLENFCTTIDVEYFTGSNKIGERSFEAVYFVKPAAADAENIARLIKDDGRADAFFENPARMMFLINKEAYLELLKKLSPLSSSLKRGSTYDELYLLRLLSLLAGPQGKGPALLDEAALALLTKVLGKPAEALKLIKKYFNDLFEFPIMVPEIRFVNVAGTFKVRTPDDSSITARDLSNYDLSVEYSLGDRGPDRPEIIHSDWSRAGKITDNTASFSFTDAGPIIENGIDGMISVNVKGYDGSVLYSNEFNPQDPELGSLSIEVPMMIPIVLAPSDKPGLVDRRKKFRGQVIGLSSKCNLKGVTVVIQAKKDGDTLWRIVGAAYTDNSGNFSLPYPYGPYIEAQAIVSLSPNSPADISIVSGGDPDQTISDDFLYLLVKEADCIAAQSEEECGCKDSAKPSRLPDYADLIGSGEYSQDLGGACVNLSKPNRTLNEYNYKAVVRTSDPDVANYTLSKVDKVVDGAVLGTSYTLAGGARKLRRTTVDLTNPIKWEDAPDDKKNLSFYQAVTISTGHVLHYKALFKADGYSLGDLLFSLALAPGQKKEIVVLDSSHTLQGAESQTISQGERLAAGIVDDREITNQLSGALSESLRGSSSANTSGISAGLGIGAIIGPVGAVLGVSGGAANSNSSASQDSSRNVSQFFGEKLRQSIMQNAEGYRQLNASVVTTVQEGQRYAATTEVVANHNHCHALTMMYFEVLRHYAIYQELSSVEECVFVPLLMTNFTTQNIYKWGDVLAPRLLPMPSSTYLQPYSFIGVGRQHPLLKAFDANDRIRTNYANVDFPAGSYDAERINFVKGEINLRTNLQRPKTRYDRILSLPVISQSTTTSNTAGAVEGGIIGSLIGSVVGSVVPIIGPIIGSIVGGAAGANIGSDPTTAVTLVKKQIFDSFMQLDANYQTVPPAQCIRITNFKPVSIHLPFGLGAYTVSGTDFFENSVIDKQQWKAYAKILGYSDVLDMLEYYFKDRLIAEWDDIYYNDIAPIIFARIVDSINIDPINTDMTSTTQYRGGERLMRINLRGTTTKKRNEFPNIIKLFSGRQDIKALKDLVVLTVENVSIYYSTSHYNGTLFSGYLGDDLLDDTELYIPENSEEKRNPRKEDAYLVNKLIEHLNSNLEYYNKVLWYNLDPDRRYMLLDGFSIQIFNDFNQPAGFRSLASVVKNELITITGNSLVFPVAAGYRVSQSYITEKTEDGTEAVNLFDHYKPLTPIEPYRISVPSKGVFAEAVLGACNSCEKIETDRLQDWNKFPNTDAPPQILPVNPPTPTITDWKAAFKDFATPMINIQNAPAAPAPGAGLAGLSDLLGKSGIFKDVTGLDTNQQNVLKTYLSNQENARAFAEMAKEMAMQAHNTENSDKIMSSLSEAKKSGAISKEDYGNLVKEHLQRQIDGGESKKVELEKEKASKPTLTDAAVKAAGQGKEVKAQKTDTEGNAESIEISGGKTSTVLAKVPGTVPKLKQENSMACWATSATMMVSWKKGATLPVQDVLAQAGGQYVTKFNNKEGLLASEKQDFITALNMTGEGPADYSLQQYIDWLNAYGPLWITTDAATAVGVFSPHARILTEIVGTGTSDGIGTDFIFNDPATGTERKESFTDFIKAFEQAITDNAGAAFIQVVHFKDRIVAGEGGEPPMSEEEKVARLKADNMLDFAGKKAYLEYIAGKSFSEAIQSVYTLSRITVKTTDATRTIITAPAGSDAIKDLMDRTTSVDAEKAAYKAVDDKGVLKRLKLIYDEDIPADLTDIEKAEAAQFFANQMEVNRSEIQTEFDKTGAEDHLTLKSFPANSDVKENVKTIIHTCLKFAVSNKKHLSYCLATANGESRFQPVMEGSFSHTFLYSEKYAQYYYSALPAVHKASYNTGGVATGQTQLSDYLISKLTALNYLKVTSLPLRTFTKGDNIDDSNFAKLNTLLTASMSSKDASNKWTDVSRDETETAALFDEMKGIVNAETPAKRVITDDMLQNADFYRYAGKGFIQTTGKEAYKNVTEKIKIDFPGFSVVLENEPEKILLAENAIYALVLGLKHGAYGSRKELGFYLKDGEASTDADWEEARKCVNNEDRKVMFARCAKIYADIVFRLRG